MDGASVNWSCLENYKQHLASDDINKKLINIGSCGLHVVNGSFQTGHQASESK